LIGRADIRMADQARAAIHQRRDHYAETAFRQPPRELLLRSDAGGQSAELLRRLIGIGKRYDMAPDGRLPASSSRPSPKTSSSTGQRTWYTR